MKSRQLRTFLEEFLRTQKAESERRGENLLSVRLPRKLAPAIGGKELVLAFNLQGVQDDPHSELATVGNPVFDRILELARSAVRAGERFEAEPSGRKVKVPDPLSHFHITGSDIRLGEPRRTYTALYYLPYRIEYSMEEVADELEVVPVDSVSLQSLPQIPEVVEHWTSLQREPAPGREIVPAYPVAERIVRASLRLLERRLRKRLGRIRSNSEARLEKEIKSINDYYTQLISETRNAGKRWALPAGGREERIRLLQLDWKRRVEEAQEVWQPRLGVYLTAAAATQRPRLAFDILQSGTRGKGRTAGTGTTRTAGRTGSGSEKGRLPALYWDEIDKAYVDPPCSRCGALDQREFGVVDGGFICLRCLRLDGEV